MQSAPQRTLYVRSERTASGGVRLTVKDTGRGIDPSDLDHVFEPLFTTKAGGMGMGLSICRSIVEAHGGRIRAFVAPQRGAVFEVELPDATAAGIDKRADRQDTSAP
jgi:signal transduction histidine kinase